MRSTKQPLAPPVCQTQLLRAKRQHNPGNVGERGGPEHRQVQHERGWGYVWVLRGGARAWQNLSNGTQYKFTESTGRYMNSAIMSEIGDK